MIYNDKRLSEMPDLFFPYYGEKQRINEQGKPAISYGLSQAGYDLTLSADKFLVYSPPEHQQVFLCPKLSQAILPVEATLNETDEGSYFWLPPHCSALGASNELITMPNDAIAFGYGKSTYARLGIIANVTPIEPGWAGHLTISIVNPTPMFARIWANEGIVQIVFADCGEVEKPYEGAYQNQGKDPKASVV